MVAIPDNKVKLNQRKCESGPAMETLSGAGIRRRSGYCDEIDYICVDSFAARE